MGSERVVGIVLYGEIKETKDLWKTWLLYAKSISGELDCKLTHISILCDSLKSNLKTLSRSGKRILEVIDNDENIQALSLYALKKGYRSVVENEVCLILSSKYKYAYCEISFEKYNQSIGKRILGEMGNFVRGKNSEIFSMERDQVAFNYVMKGRGYDVSKYPTLKLL